MSHASDRRAPVGRRRAAALAGLLALASGASPASGEDLRTFVADVGTGLGVFLEVPRGTPGAPPVRILYDAGIQVSGVMARFLTSPEVGLRPAGTPGLPEGEVIDLVVLSHPHQDHYAGMREVFETFDVRTVIESKQRDGVTYCRDFKAPALEEVLRARRERDVDAHYYVVALPYPRGFVERDADGRRYDERALFLANLPPPFRGRVDLERLRALRYPWTPEEAAQLVEVPVDELPGGCPDALAARAPDLRGAAVPVELLPIGTRVPLGAEGEMIVLHGDTIDALDPDQHDDATYREAWPYYAEADANDASVAVRVRYRRARILIPGDAEGRWTTPGERFALGEVAGDGGPRDTYSRREVRAHLQALARPGAGSPVLPEFERYVFGSRYLNAMARISYVPLPEFTPEDLEVRGVTYPARALAEPGDLDEEAAHWHLRSRSQRRLVGQAWRERLVALHERVARNSQTLSGMKQRFASWTRGSPPRLLPPTRVTRFLPNWHDPLWTLRSAHQVLERIYYVDPVLANLLTGMLLRSPRFLDYMAPLDPELQQARAEKHMIDLANLVEEETEGAEDLLAADVLVLGHHGSYTSTSYGFMLRVNPSVGVISADDKAYSGTPLPDLSTLFWNLNHLHPDGVRAANSVFLHADVLARRREETGPYDDAAAASGISPSQILLEARRGMPPVALWRTDWNDDLTDQNALEDNIRIVTDGRRPIWEEARGAALEGGAFDPEGARAPAYWAPRLMQGHPVQAEPLRPVDPSGVISTFAVGP